MISKVYEVNEAESSAKSLGYLSPSSTLILCRLLWSGVIVKFMRLSWSLWGYCEVQLTRDSVNFHSSNHPGTLYWPCGPDRIPELQHCRYLLFLETSVPQFLKVCIPWSSGVQRVFVWLQSCQCACCHFWLMHQRSLLLARHSPFIVCQPLFI